jgi:hypothetical protein
VFLNILKTFKDLPQKYSKDIAKDYFTKKAGGPALGVIV